MSTSADLAHVAMIDDGTSGRHRWLGLAAVMTLATVIRLIDASLVDVLYRDTIGFITHAHQFSAESLYSSRQEPLHPFLLRCIHDAITPSGCASPVPRVAPWTVAVWLNGTLFSLAAMMLLYHLGRHLHSSLAGVIAAGFLIAMPYATAYSVHGLSEWPHIVAVLGSIVLILHGLSHQRRIAIVCAGVCAMLAVLTRKEGVVLIGIVSVYLLGRRDEKLSDRLRQLAWFLAGTIGAALVYYAIGGRFHWLSDYLDILRKFWNRRFAEHAAQTVGGTHLLALQWLQHRYEYLLEPLSGLIKLSGFLPAILFFLYLLLWQKMRLPRGVALLTLYILAHVAMICTQTFVSKFFVTRYMFPACVVMLPIAGAVLCRGLQWTNTWPDRRRLAARRAFAVVLTVFLVAMIAETLQNAWADRCPQIRNASRWLNQNSAADETVFVGDARLGFYAERPAHSMIAAEVIQCGRRLVAAKKSGVVAMDHRAHRREAFAEMLDTLPSKAHAHAEMYDVFSHKKNAVTVFRIVPGFAPARKTSASTAQTRPTSPTQRPSPQESTTAPAQRLENR